MSIERQLHKYTWLFEFLQFREFHGFLILLLHVVFEGTRQSSTKCVLATLQQYSRKQLQFLYWILLEENIFHL